MKKRILELIESVKRPGIDDLLKWIELTDFFDAPASTKYHGAKKSGLLEHSAGVYIRMKQLNLLLELHFNNESIILTSLLHDLCKANFYNTEMRNRKNEAGQWEKYPCYIVDDQLPYGHGEKSVFLISKFIDLSNEEAMAIRWHMGFSTTESYADKQALSAAMEKYPLILALQMADQAATFWDKK
jgi:hypothetical protein